MGLINATDSHCACRFMDIQKSIGIIITVQNGCSLYWASQYRMLLKFCQFSPRLHYQLTECPLSYKCQANLSYEFPVQFGGPMRHYVIGYKLNHAGNPTCLVKYELEPR